MAKLLILTEAGSKVGFGHLKRCLAIAKETDALIYVHFDGSHAADNSIKNFPWRTNLDQLFSMISSSTSILIDSYLADRKTYQLLSNYFFHVTVIDDFNRLNYPVDLLINPGVKMPDYKNQSANVVGGKEYVILRDEIIKQKKKTNYLEYKNLLVTFGGGCDIEIYNWLVPLIDKHLFSSISIVCGHNKSLVLLLKKFKNFPIKWHGEISGEDMAKLMYQADICISAGGQTLHELAYIGVPTICIKTGEDQVLNIEGYLEAGFLMKNFPLLSNILPIRLSSLLEEYNDLELRQNTTSKGKAFIEGLGARKIAKLISQSVI